MQLLTILIGVKWLKNSKQSNQMQHNTEDPA